MIMMLALSMLATTATAGPVDKLKGDHSNMRRRLLKLQTATGMAQSQTCKWIWGNRYCPSNTQFNCCAGETNKKWTGCTVEDNNYHCPSNRPKAVCCRA